MIKLKSVSTVSICVDIYVVEYGTRAQKMSSQWALNSLAVLRLPDSFCWEKKFIKQN